MKQKDKDTLEKLLYQMQEELESEDDKESVSSIIELMGNLK